MAAPNRKEDRGEVGLLRVELLQIDSPEHAVMKLIPTSLPPLLTSPTDGNSTSGIGCCIDMDGNTKQCCVKGLKSGVGQVSLSSAFHLGASVPYL